MRIYVDLDDVLCETARALSRLARDLFGRRVPYPSIHAFDLHLAFNLDHPQYLELMERAHQPEFLMNLAPTPGAAASLRRWRREGHDVSIVTGRPSACHVPTEQWLAREGLDWVRVLYVDKYNRAHIVPPGAPRTLTAVELRGERFDVAIDDSPAALDALLSYHPCPAIVFDRPWNGTYTHVRGKPLRCRTWADVRRVVGELEVPRLLAPRGARAARSFHL